jgi:hypothetical protein
MEDVLERIFDGSIEPRDVKLSALESITQNFSEERIIGAGGFGTVYKVNLTFHRKSGLDKQNIFSTWLVKTCVFDPTKEQHKTTGKTFHW